MKDVMKVLGAATALLLLSAQTVQPPADEFDSTPVDIRLGTQLLRIPKNYLKALWHRPVQDYIALRVYFPEFTPVHGDARTRADINDGSQFAHVVEIGINTYGAQRASFNFAQSGLEETPFGLYEVRNDIYPDGRYGVRRFAGTLDGVVLIFDCDDRSLVPPVRGLVNETCHFEFSYGFGVFVRFDKNDLKDWRKIYQETRALLDRLPAN
jgi:hypothetical protein